MTRDIISLLLALALALPWQGQAADLASLPDMGDASASVLTPEREQRIGRAMWRQLRQAGMIVDDPQLNGYVRDIGYRLLSAGAHGNHDFTFFLVDAPSINAFAMPGGYIGIHTGLVTATSSEDELAAVLAHEIAHVTQNHLARGYDKANRMNLPMTAAMIAAILLGAQSPEMAEATIAATTAGAVQMQIDFTRAHEKEADRLGIEMLSSAGYEPTSMAGFFGKLQEKSRYYGSGAPEFLRTHPVNESRIADAEGRAARMAPNKPRSSPDDAYWVAKAHLKVRAASDPASLARELRRQLEAGRSENQEADRFALGLALSAEGEYGEARPILSALLNKKPERIAYRQALAELEVRAGNHKAASALLEEGLELYPDNETLLLTLGESRLLAGDAETARRHLERAIRTAPEGPPEGYRLLSRAEAALGHEAASRLALGEYYFRIGETHSAIDQLTAARTYATDDFYLGSRIEARLEQLKREAELEREGQKPG